MTTYTKFSMIGQHSEQNPSIENLQHLLVMQPDTIGDVVMLSPALRTLKEAIPQAENTLLTSSRGSQAAPLLPWIDDVMVYPALWRDITETSLLNLRKDMSFLEGLRQRRFSMALIFTGVSQSPWPSAYACYLAGVPYRVGFTKDVEASALLLFLSPPADDLHPVDRNLNLLEAIGIYDANNQLELNISKEIEKRANDLLIENGVTQGSRYLVLAPEPGVATDSYDPDRFAAAARILAAQTELQLVVVGSSEEAEAVRPLLQVTRENLYGNVRSLVGKTPLPELAAVIRQASLTVTGRSAVMHVSDAFRCPLVVLYPETDNDRIWNPHCTSARVLSRPASCSHCSEPNCYCGMKCLDIRPEEIAIAALELLEEQTYSSGTYHVLQEYRSGLLEI